MHLLIIALIIAVIGLVLLAGLILGIAFVVARGNRAGGVFTARQEWMDSHGGDYEEHR